MHEKDLYSLLQKLLFTMILFFILFIIMINVIKFIELVFKIDSIIKQTNTEEGEIPRINIEPKYKNVQNGTIKNHKNYTAKELGFVNALYTLNGSEWGNGINILLVGSDKKSYKDGKSRADVIIVLRINNQGKLLSISIPRDTLIQVLDGKWTGEWDKIGHSLYWDGLENLKRNVEHLLGSPIYKVAIIDNFRNYEAFLAIIDGVDIDQCLYGKTGIDWIRNRNFKDGDIERCRRQQVFIKKSVNKIWQISHKGNFLYAKFIYDALKMIINTDLSKADFIKILKHLKKNHFNPATDLLTGVLPGDFNKYDSILLNRKNLDCWVVNEQIIKKLKFLFYSDNNSQVFITQKDPIFFNFWPFYSRIRNKPTAFNQL